MNDRRITAKIDRLKKRLPLARAALSPCRICPRQCGSRRLQGETGFCGTGFDLMIASDTLHRGEEPPISGTRGSGTLFFSGCGLKCVFCQNYPISQLVHGRIVSPEDLAFRMLELQRRGAHNINLVTPSHFIPQIMESLLAAYQNGLSIPLVYNSSGYDSVETLQWLDGVVDIYMPDMKVDDGKTAGQYFSAADYPGVNRRAVVEMFRQVGLLQTDPSGIALRGLLIRHLVLPGHKAGSRKIFRFIAESLSPLVHISLMSQYFPAHQALNLPPLDRRISRLEYRDAKSAMSEAGLFQGWFQDP